MNDNRYRLDVYLTEYDLVKSRTLAAQLIKQGAVSVNGNICTKPSFPVSEADEVEITGELPKYVGRGGYKLEGALKAFDVSLKNLVCMDVGASTGGFTDCMLQNGAAKVYAIDVGTDQLDSSLRSDNRVVSMENTDIRSLTGFSVQPQFISADVSFISLKQVLPPIYNILQPGGALIALIKPQFEAGKKNLNKKGIVKDSKVHKQVCEEIEQFAVNLGFISRGIIRSDITGGDGNTEFLIYLVKPAE